MSTMGDTHMDKFFTFMIHSDLIRYGVTSISNLLESFIKNYIHSDLFKDKILKYLHNYRKNYEFSISPFISTGLLANNMLDSSQDLLIVERVLKIFDYSMSVNYEQINENMYMFVPFPENVFNNNFIMDIPICNTLYRIKNFTHLLPRVKVYVDGKLKNILISTELLMMVKMCIPVKLVNMQWRINYILLQIIKQLKVY